MYNRRTPVMGLRRLVFCAGVYLNAGGAAQYTNSAHDWFSFQLLCGLRGYLNAGGAAQYTNSAHDWHSS